MFSWRRIYRRRWQRWRPSTSRDSRREERRRRSRWAALRNLWNQRSFFSSIHNMDRGPAFDRRVFNEHGAEEAGYGGGKKRHEGKTEHGGAKLGMPAQIAA